MGKPRKSLLRRIKHKKGNTLVTYEIIDYNKKGNPSGRIYRNPIVKSKPIVPKSN